MQLQETKNSFLCVVVMVKKRHGFSLAFFEAVSVKTDKMIMWFVTER